VPGHQANQVPDATTGRTSDRGKAPPWFALSVASSKISHTTSHNEAFCRA